MDQQGERMAGDGPAAAGAPGRDQEPIGVVFARLTDNIRKFFDAYAVLAAEEARRTRRDVMLGVAFLGVAAVLGFFALAFGLTAAVLALSLALQPWLAALVLCVVSGLAAGLLVLTAARRLRFRRLMTLVRNVREDIRWIRRQLLGSA